MLNNWSNFIRKLTLNDESNLLEEKYQQLNSNHNSLWKITKIFSNFKYQTIYFNEPNILIISYKDKADLFGDHLLKNKLTPHSIL